MDFLKDLDFNLETIEKIKENNMPSVVRQFICDKENAIKVIEYLRSVGVSVVDDLLIRRLEIFSIDYNRIKASFDAYNVSVLVALINEDISAINFL